jgi:uncharacterized protein YegP (UPF0339 family)
MPRELTFDPEYVARAHKIDALSILLDEEDGEWRWRLKASVDLGVCILAAGACATADAAAAEAAEALREAPQAMERGGDARAARGG